jgi:hypothetical protein
MDAYAGAVSRQAVPLAAPRLCQVNQAGCGSGGDQGWPTLAGRHRMARQGMTHQRAPLRLSGPSWRERVPIPGRGIRLAGEDNAS